MTVIRHNPFTRFRISILEEDSWSDDHPSVELTNKRDSGFVRETTAILIS